MDTMRSNTAISTEGAGQALEMTKGELAKARRAAAAAEGRAQETGEGVGEGRPQA